MMTRLNMDANPTYGIVCRPIVFSPLTPTERGKSNKQTQAGERSLSLSLGRRRQRQ